MDMVIKKELHLVAEMEQVGYADICDASDNANFLVNYVDHRTGLALDPKIVQQARAEEMNIFAEVGVHEHVPEQEFQADPHSKLIGTTSADCDEGSPGREEYRSRLCVQEFAKGEQRDDLFAVTPSFARDQAAGFPLCIDWAAVREEADGVGRKLSFLARRYPKTCIVQAASQVC